MHTRSYPSKNYVAAVAAFAATLLSAQENVPVPENQTLKLETYTVTGSLINRPQAESATPVVQFRMDEVDLTGATGPADYLKKQGFALPLGSKGPGSDGEGETSVGLRGLPSKNTLFLVNGFRVSQDGINESANMSAIPTGAIKRVEVFKGAASTIYGSDAVGGVINYVLKDNFTGAQTDILVGAPKSKGGDTYQASVVVGTSVGTGQLILGASFEKRRQIMIRHSSWANKADGPGLGTSANWPGIFQLPAGVAGPAGFYTLKDGVTNPQSADDFRRYNVDTEGYNNLNDAILFQPENKTHAFASYRYQFPKSGVTLFGQLIYGKLFFDRNSGKFSMNISGGARSVPRVDGTNEIFNMTIPSTNYWNQKIFGANAVNIVRYGIILEEFGPLDIKYRRDELQFALGAEGDLFSNFKWRAQYSRSEMYRSEQEHYDVDFTAWGNRLARTDPSAYNPFGRNPESVLLDLKAVTGFDENAYDDNFTAVIQGKTRGFLGEENQLAFGLEKRRQVIDRTLSPTAYKLFGSLPYSTHRDTISAFGEADIPIGKTLRVTPSARYDHTEGRFDSTVGAITGRWQPSKKFLLRGSFNQAFVAPTVGEADNAFRRQGGVGIFDSRNGLNYTIYRDSTGNANLKPEKSDIIGLGIVTNPVKGLEISVDWFHIETKDVIATLGEQPIIDAHIAGGGPANPSAPYAGLISYDPSSDRFISVRVTPNNLGRRRLEGIDFDVRYTVPQTLLDRLVLSATASHYLKYDLESTPGAGFRGFVGNNFFNGYLVPAWKGNIGFDVKKGRYSGHFSANYLDGFTETVSLLKIASQTTCDVSVAAELPWNLKVSVGADNVFDSPPPVSARQRYDAYRFHELKGAFYYMRFSARY